jgi:hypothetical protein
MQHLRQVRIHACTFAGGKDDDVQCVHIVLCFIDARVYLSGNKKAAEAAFLVFLILEL